MVLKASVKTKATASFEEYEGRIEHLYLDSVGKVTVGVGHMVSSKTLMSGLSMYKAVNGVPMQLATDKEKQDEYDVVSKLDSSHLASWYKSKTSLVMKGADIDALRENDITTFYSSLTRIYTKSSGYPSDFDDLPDNVQLALFDMIFNLGATGIITKFPTFNSFIKTGDWAKAADQANRTGLSTSRNEYVKQLLIEAGKAAEAEKK